MITTPITTPHFQTNVQALLSSYYASRDHDSTPEALPFPLIPPLTPADTPLTPHESVGQLLATTSSWIDLTSPDPVIADVSRQVFNLEIAYAAFCGIPHVSITGPLLSRRSNSGGGLALFARAIQEALSVGPYLQLHIRLPLSPGYDDDVDEDPAHLSHIARFSTAGNSSNGAGGAAHQWQAWEAWDFIRTFCKFNMRVWVALTLSSHVPAPAVLARWFSEPLRSMFLPKSSFKLNHFEQPVLSKGHKALLTKYMRLRTPWLILSDVGPLNPLASTSLSATLGSDLSDDPFPSLSETSQMSKNVQSVRKDPTPHLSYLRYLQRNQPQRSPMETFSAGYQDFLQAPLQPLADNLESITYEVFEKDPIKYDWYERAIMHALIDWSSHGKSVSSSSGAVVVAVVGAGRGPLVARALRAGQLAQVQIEVWALEKNPNAYVILQQKNETIWDRQVTVVKSDMRSWNGPVHEDGTQGHVDIMVSELLGSFADNELSPECLDGVQHVLNPTHGISIPASYTAHLTPIATPKIYADLLGKSMGDKDAFEVPYVVLLHAFDFLSVEPESLPSIEEDASVVATQPSQDMSSSERRPDVQTCWQFDHPLPPAILDQANLRRGGSAKGGGGGHGGGDGANEHNSRFCSLTFKCADRGVCHGLAGYFETVLYSSSDPQDESGDFESIELSINPVTMDEKSKDMISWFPMFFPLRTPLSFPDNTELCVSMWRFTDDRKVWYEWVVESYMVVADGQKLRLGMSEVHSSKKNGCLM